MSTLLSAGTARREPSGRRCLVALTSLWCHARRFRKALGGARKEIVELVEGPPTTGCMVPVTQ